MTTAREAGNTGETRPIASVLRVTHVTTRGFLQPPLVRCQERRFFSIKMFVE